MPRIRRWLGWILATIVVLALLGAIAAGGLYYAISSKLPDVQSLKQVELQEPMYVYSSDGRLMAVYGETRRYPIQMKDVPLRLKQAFLATEDARFYQHGGVDYKGIARRGVAADHHRCQARTGWVDHHPAGGAAVLSEFRVQLHPQAGGDPAGAQDRE